MNKLHTSDWVRVQSSCVTFNLGLKPPSRTPPPQQRPENPPLLVPHLPIDTAPHLRPIDTIGDSKGREKREEMRESKQSLSKFHERLLRLQASSTELNNRISCMLLVVLGMTLNCLHRVIFLQHPGANVLLLLKRR